jgi:hypothetical protein
MYLPVILLDPRSEPPQVFDNPPHVVRRRAGLALLLSVVRPSGKESRE